MKFDSQKTIFASGSDDQARIFMSSQIYFSLFCRIDRKMQGGHVQLVCQLFSSPRSSFRKLSAFKLNILVFTRSSRGDPTGWFMQIFARAETSVYTARGDYKKRIRTRAPLIIATQRKRQLFSEIFCDFYDAKRCSSRFFPPIWGLDVVPHSCTGENCFGAFHRTDIS
jgi:hypothetical protein